MKTPLKVSEKLKPIIKIGTPRPLEPGPGWIVVSKKGKEDQHITVISGTDPILYAINEVQKRNWEGLQLIIRPAVFE